MATSFRLNPWGYVAIAVLVILIIAGLYWRLYVPRVAPQRALGALAEAKSYHVVAEIALNQPLRVRNRERPFPFITGTIEGDVQRNNSGTPELTGTVSGKASGTGEDFILEGGLRILDDAVAFRLTDFPVLLNPTGSLRNRWTYVAAPVTRTQNSGDIREVLTSLFSTLHADGKVDVKGTSARRYSGSITADDEQRLINVLNRQASGNQAYHILARLLAAYDVREFHVDLSSARDIERITIVFEQTLRDGNKVDRAAVKLSFTNLNKDVTIDRPPVQVNVRADVFARLFGTGEIEPQ